MRVRVDPATLEPVGGPERVAGGGMYDDFCIDDGRDRTYLTVHRENRIDSVPLRPGGIVRPLAGALLNEMMLGPSSAAWSRAPGEAGQVVYVTTDGGQTAPPPDGSSGPPRCCVWNSSRPRLQQARPRENALSCSPQNHAPPRA